ncbi:MAG: response regulator [Flavobacterium sp.]|nr:MAG: response regulator [Flavobacterium sp.]
MPKKLLLIDNDPDEFDFLTSASEKIPGTFNCSYASSAEQALATVMESQPDYILVDMNMPEVDGLELIEQLKLHPFGAKVPTFLYTVCYDDALRREAMKRGADGYIAKPALPELLADMLQTLYNKGKF